MPASRQIKPRSRAATLPGWHDALTMEYQVVRGRSHALMSSLSKYPLVLLTEQS